MALSILPAVALTVWGIERDLDGRIVWRAIDPVGARRTGIFGCRIGGRLGHIAKEAALDLVGSEYLGHGLLTVPGYFERQAWECAAAAVVVLEPKRRRPSAAARELKVM